MTRVRHVALAAALLLVLASPSSVAAHAELVTATPEDGATVDAGPIDIIGTYSEEVGPKSHMELLDASGDVVARASIDGKTLRIGLEGLQPGAYRVRWTTVTSDDNGVERGAWSFTVAAASPSPTVVASPSGSPSAAPSLSAPATVSSAPSSSAKPTSPSNASSGDVLLPIVAALVVVALLGGLLLRRRTPTAR
jgi:methionine-rich copper-binding protein CopC